MERENREYAVDTMRNQTLIDVLRSKTTLNTYHMKKTMYEHIKCEGRSEYLRLIPWVDDSFLRQAHQVLLDSFKYLNKMNVRTDEEGKNYLISHMMKIKSTCADVESAFEYFNMKAAEMEELSMEKLGLISESDSGTLAMEDEDLPGDPSLSDIDDPVDLPLKESTSSCILTQGSNTYPAKCELGKVVNNIIDIKLEQISFEEEIARPYRTSTPLASISLDPDHETLHGELNVSDIKLESTIPPGDPDSSNSNPEGDSTLGYNLTSESNCVDISVNSEATTIPQIDLSQDLPNDFHSWVFFVRREEELRLLVATLDSHHSDTDPDNE